MVRVAWAAAIIALTVIYALCTVSFGLRFSNLTHRGIITDGPYRFTKHPAYLAKNLSWWLISVPFVSEQGWGAALRNCMLLALLNLIYYARARTEERHLSRDPDVRGLCDLDRPTRLAGGAGARSAIHPLPGAACDAAGLITPGLSRWRLINTARRLHKIRAGVRDGCRKTVQPETITRKRNRTTRTSPRSDNWARARHPVKDAYASRQPME